LRGVDTTSTVVALDNVTRVGFVGANIEFDLDGDVLFNENPDDVIAQLTAGEISFNFQGVLTGAGTFVVVDQHGNQETFTFTFS